MATNSTSQLYAVYDGTHRYLNSSRHPWCRHALCDRQTVDDAELIRRAGRIMFWPMYCSERCQTVSGEPPKRRRALSDCFRKDQPLWQDDPKRLWAVRQHWRRRPGVIIDNITDMGEIERVIAKLELPVTSLIAHRVPELLGSRLHVDMPDQETADRIVEYLNHAPSEATELPS